MIYVIDGSEQVFIEHKISELIKQENAYICKFDGNSKEFDLNEMINACQSNNLFGDKNIVLVKDAPFLCKKVDENQLSSLYEYVSNPSFETDLIFYTLDSKINSKLKTYKEIIKNAQVFNFNSLDYRNFSNFVNSEISRNKLDINKDAVMRLNNICKRDATLLIKNIEILINYPGTITSEVVDKLCTISDDNDAFDMINALTNRNISKTIELERKLLNENDSVMSVIGLLSSQLRFLYQIAYLRSINKNKNEILDETKCSEYRYSKALETLNKLTLKKIAKLLNDLSKLDIECKSNVALADNQRFELFILNLMKKDTHASN